MGGSVVTKSCPILLQNRYKIAGVAVLDVVEGSAIDALPHMNSILNARPDGFDSVEEAVEWQSVVSFFSRQLWSQDVFLQCHDEHDSKCSICKGIYTSHSIP